MLIVHWILLHWYHVLKLLTIVILKSLVRFTNLIRVWIHHVWLVETLHSSWIHRPMGHWLVLHVALRVGVHINLLILLHIHTLSMRVLMHCLWRVKAISMNLLVVLVHLIWHWHVLIHVHLGLVLHLSIWVDVTHLLVWNVLVLHVGLLSVLYVLNTLLMWLHLINMFLILLIQIFICLRFKLNWLIPWRSTRVR